MQLNTLFIQDTNSSQTHQFYYIITFKATCFNCIDSSSGLLENRSNVSTFIVHSGNPKVYNRWYSQYKSTRASDMCIFILTLSPIVSFLVSRMHYKCWYIGSVLQKAWWWLSTVETCCLKCNYIIKLLFSTGICILYEFEKHKWKTNVKWTHYV
jgi:hypothetical protein